MYAKCLHRTIPCASSLIVEKGKWEMVTMWQPHEWRQCQARANAYSQKHKHCKNVRVWVEPHPRASTTKAIIITKIRKGTHFCKHFITFEYYLSMVRSTNASTDHVLIFVLSLCSTFSLLTRSRVPVHTHTLPRTFSLDSFFSQFIYFSVCSFFILSLQFEARSSYCFLICRIFFFSSSLSFIILFLIMVSFFKQFDKLSMLCCNALCASGWMQGFKWDNFGIAQFQ